MFVVHIQWIRIVFDSIDEKQVSYGDFYRHAFDITQRDDVIINIVPSLSITNKNRASVYRRNTRCKIRIVMTHATQNYFNVKVVFKCKFWFAKIFVVTFYELKSWSFLLNCIEADMSNNPIMMLDYWYNCYLKLL